VQPGAEIYSERVRGRFEHSAIGPLKALEARDQIGHALMTIVRELLSNALDH